MIQKIYLFISIILISFFPISMFPLEPVILTDSKGEYSLGLHLEYLKDKDKKLKIEDVTSPKFSNQFVKSKHEISNFGLTDSAYWIRFKLKNNSDKDKWLIKLTATLFMYNLKLYTPARKGFDVKEWHSSDSFSKREVKTRHSVFNLLLAPNQEKIFYMYCEADYIAFSLNLFSPETFLHKNRQEELLYGIYIGIVLIIIIFNIFHFFSLKDINYLYYVFFVAGAGLVILSFEGFAFEYLAPDTPWMNNKASLFFTVVAIFGYTIFGRSFLKTKLYTPKLDRSLFIFMALTVVLMVYTTFGNFHISVLLGHIFVSIGTSTFLFISILCWRNNFRPARYYFIANLFVVIGVVFFSLISIPEGFPITELFL